MANRTTVLDSETAKRKIERIAWEIYERHIDESELYVIGIAESGYKLAQRILDNITRISPLKCELLKLEVDKKDPAADIIMDAGGIELDGKSVVIVDDVLNSGSTLIYAVKYILDWKVKRCMTAVLVDRSHKRFPIKADVKGVSLSTSLQEHVQVEFEGESATAYLS